MSLKLIAPFSGILGVITGATASSSYFLSSSKVLTDSLTHKDIESIEVSFNCSKDLSGRPTEKNDFTFKWFGKIDKEQLDKLKRERNILVKGNFSLSANKEGYNISKFVQEGEKNVHLTATAGNKDNLHITVGKYVTSRSTMDSVAFWCNADKNKLEILRNAGDDGHMLFIEMIALDSKKLSSVDIGKGEMKVSLVECHNNVEREANTCKLQISGVSESKWSIKVSDKERYTFYR